MGLESETRERDGRVGRSSGKVEWDGRVGERDGRDHARVKTPWASSDEGSSSSGFESVTPSYAVVVLWGWKTN